MSKMTREEWNAAYEARIVEQSGYTATEAKGLGDCSDDDFNDGVDPVESADEEMTYWTD